MAEQRIAIVGSRDFPIKDMIYAFLKELVNENRRFTLVSGGAKGVDSFAEEAARVQKQSRFIFEADWDAYGLAAGPVRNGLVVETSDQMVAFFADRKSSKGTTNAVSQALDAGLPVRAYDLKNKEWFSP